VAQENAYFGPPRDGRPSDASPARDRR